MCSVVIIIVLIIMILSLGYQLRKLKKLKNELQLNDISSVIY